MDYRVTPFYKKDIREFVEFLWKKIGYDPKSLKPLPVPEILEVFMPLIDPDFSLEVIPDKQMDNGNLHGATFPQKHLIQLKESVYEGMVEGKGRDRMTATHEVGHYFLHADEELALTKAVKELSLNPWESAEWQGKRFAGEFLMPHDMIQNMSIFEIADIYGVSEDAARFMKNNP